MRYEPKARPLNFCRACGKDFTSEKYFDGHRKGSYMPMARRCLTVPELITKGYDLDDNERWFHVESAKRAREWFQNAP